MTSTGIPASWTIVPLKELGDWSGGGTPSKAKAQYWQGGTIPWVSPKDMKTERISDSEDHITKEAVSHSTTSLINAGSVLIVTRSGILRHTLPVAVNSVSVTVNQDLKALTPRNGILAEYVAWALRAFSRDILHTCSKQGTTVNSVETSKLLGFEIPVAPRGQQAKIVAEIEKQFSRLDEAVANLKRVKANLKRYKASVLKAAVEGKLTEEWRKAHPDNEPASKLLERILADRRGKWTDKGKCKEPSALEVIDFPSLPKGWTWASLDQLSWDSSYGTSVKCSYNNSGPAVLRIPNIASGKLDLRDLKFAPDSYEVGRGDKLSAGDLLIIRTNGSRNLIGRSAVVRQPLPSASAFASYLIRFRLAQQLEIIKWLSAIWDAEHFRVWIEKRASTSAGQHNISMSVLARLPVPLPPLAEQDQIVSEVERRLSVIEALEAAVEANLTRADRLRQSILARAFSGNLAGTAGVA